MIFEDHLLVLLPNVSHPKHTCFLFYGWEPKEVFGGEGFFFDEKATVLHLINECTKKIVVLILLLRCDYYHSDIWIYWQILKIILAVFDKKKDQYYNSSIAFLTSFFCSHHHWATLKTKHKPHQISDFVTFFFSAFFFN